MADLVALIAASRADRAVEIDFVLCQLIVRGRELGELEPAAAVGVDGDWREIRLPPQAWLDRLARAIEVGAFHRLEPLAIIDRILTTPGRLHPVDLRSVASRVPLNRSFTSEK